MEESPCITLTILIYISCKSYKAIKNELKRNVPMNYKDHLFFYYYFLIRSGSDSIGGN